MQVPGDLNGRELRAYHRSLVEPQQERRIRVAVQTLEGRNRASITPVVLDGQVSVRRVRFKDAAKLTTRVLTMSFLDPGNSLNFDPHSPGPGALYANRMLRVHDSRHVDELGRWVTAVPFTGPVFSYERTGDEVHVVAHGKERLAQDELGRTRTFREDTPVVDVIRSLMEDTGETMFDLPKLRATLPRNLSLAPTAIPWVVCQRLARSLNRQLYYPGTGRLTFRRLPRDPVFTFNTGEGGEVIGEASTSYSMENFANVFIVVGAKPKGAKKRVRGKAVIPDDDPLSQESLGRNGKPWRVVRRVRNPHLTTKRACNEKAEQLRDDAMQQVADARFDSVPISHLDEGDLCRLRQADGDTRFRQRDFVIPLGAEGEPRMTVGYIERTTGGRRR